MTSRIICCLNSGSSSLKFALYRISRSEESLLAQGALERRDSHSARLWIQSAQEMIETTAGSFSPPTAALQAIFGQLDGLALPRPDAFGHRVVHGGPEHSAPERITDALLEELRAFVLFAPLHLPDEIAGIEAVASDFSSLPQVACFDTAFHRSMPEVAQRFPLPRALWDEGIRRYGFHGISYEYIMRTLKPPPSRIIIAHLGNGASMAAVKAGNPMDTTMGFAPTGGFMMGTRSGDLDPQILLHLLIQKHFDAQRVAELVNHESGLLGVSGISSDMKTLLEQRDDSPPARLAVEMFCYQLRKQIGAYTAALGGLDLLIFTGGIGERATPVRWEVCRGLEYLGLRLDWKRNEENADTISTDDSTSAVRVIPTNEDLMIARHTHELVFSTL
ncbi:MAG TPA: acetate/propionate family kinase [Myxococcota bacterium]|nr:acetate/propionate family kinase [Myxococcota bacterium]